MVGFIFVSMEFGSDVFQPFSNKESVRFLSLVTVCWEGGKEFISVGIEDSERFLHSMSYLNFQEP